MIHSVYQLRSTNRRRRIAARAALERGLVCYGISMCYELNRRHNTRLQARPFRFTCSDAAQPPPGHVSQYSGGRKVPPIPVPNRPTEPRETQSPLLTVPYVRMRSAIEETRGKVGRGYRNP